MDRHQTLRFAAQHVSPEVPDSGPPEEGHVDRGGTLITEEDERTVLLIGAEIDDALVAHELFHAIQDDVIGSLTSQDSTSDGSAAANSILEGAATYVECWYDQRCLDGAYDPCTTLPHPALDEVPLVQLAGVHQAYTTGAHFVHEVYERDGWEGVWEVHRSVPESTRSIMDPEQFFAGELSPVSIPVPFSETDDWTIFEEDRLGVYPLYTKLLSLDVVSLDDPAARAAPSLTERTGFEHVYRTELLADWRSDTFVGYTNFDLEGEIADPDGLAYAWTVEWKTEADATTIASAVEDAYDDRGSADGERWQLDGDVVGVGRDETRVTFTMAPHEGAYDALFG
ncbi:hypothetical protein OB905_06640 [Halobacteria archaeon AArc-dxtr1]|nr:hypothetical protein [Halobacteria archaeon AArc-dxtr1]